jgi:hypothetical protein
VHRGGVRAGGHTRQQRGRVMLLSKVGKGLSDQWRQRFEVNVSCTSA